jgi:dTDP-4-dehydrorhamnose 3,5-epimerase
MSRLDLTPLTLAGAKLIRTIQFEDPRGTFCETWNKRGLLSCGIDVEFVQDNWSHSRLAGTVRGLHFQAPPNAQAKLVRVTRGSILDVIVDIRRGSPTFGHHEIFKLSFDNRLQLFVPEGFLHGFVTLDANTEVFYKCSNYYSPECEGSVRFDDPDLQISWPIASHPFILSDKDAAAQPFRLLQSPFVWDSEP